MMSAPVRAIAFGAPFSFCLADDLHRIREAGPERAEGNCFVWP